MKKQCIKCGEWLSENWESEFCLLCEKDIQISNLQAELQYKDMKITELEGQNNCLVREAAKLRTMNLIDLSFQNKNVAELIDRGAELEKRFIAATAEIERLKSKLTIHDCVVAEKQIDEMEDEIEALKKQTAEQKQMLEKAVEFLRAGKRQFAPHTTNSEVDDFLKRYANKQ